MRLVDLGQPMHINPSTALTESNSAKLRLLAPEYFVFASQGRVCGIAVLSHLDKT